jgi:hypothetical protein
MDKALAKKRMDKWALFAEDYMPEVIFFSTVVNGKTVLIMSSGGPLTTEVLDDLELTIAIFRKEKAR